MFYAFGGFGIFEASESRRIVKLSEELGCHKVHVQLQCSQENRNFAQVAINIVRPSAATIPRVLLSWAFAVTQAMGDAVSSSSSDTIFSFLDFLLPIRAHG